MAKYLDGIDISSYQSDINLKKVDFDFVILKATEGTTYHDKYMDGWAQQALSLGKKLGFYHFASGKDGEAEAVYFWSKVKKYKGKAIFVLDFEAKAVSKGVSYAKKFLDKFYKLSGCRAFIYMSQSVASSKNWSSVALIHPLWVAGYPNNNRTNYYHPAQYHDLGAWSAATIRQYSSSGKIDGYSDRIDINCFYGNKKDWDEFVKPTTKITKKYYCNKYPVVLPDRGYFIKGDKGHDVKKLQKAINAVIGSNLTVDGIYGEKTFQAVKTFQKRHSLIADGKFGLKSLSVYNNLTY